MKATPVVQLSADSSCVNRRSYRAEFDALEMAELVHAIAQSPHFEAAHAPPGVASFTTEEGHQVLVVAASSRVQIRVSLDVDRDARRLAAERVAALIVRSVLDARVRHAMR